VIVPQSPPEAVNVRIPVFEMLAGLPAGAPNVTACLAYPLPAGSVTLVPVVVGVVVESATYQAVGLVAVPVVKS
jgi:hypothetical protein